MQAQLNAESLLTSHQAGELLQVTPGSILNWVRDGRMPAHRTPGGHLRIRVADLIEFIKRHEMPLPSPLKDVGKQRILIIDDDEKLLKAAKRSLRAYREHFDLELASNGIDGLVKVGTFRPHLVILDVYMPEVDGLEVCRRLKANPDTKHIDVIMVSGDLSPAIERKAKAAGATLCMEKPITIKDLALGLGLRKD